MGISGAVGAVQKLRYEDLTKEIIGAAIEVHKAVGPGLLEGVYEECLCHELKLRNLSFERQLLVPVTYKGVTLDCGYRLDLIVESTVILELKSVDRIHFRSSAVNLHAFVAKASRPAHKL